MKIQPQSGRFCEGACLQGRGEREFLDESGDQELLPVLQVLREPDLGERTIDQRAQAHETAKEYRPGAPRDADIAGALSTAPYCGVSQAFVMSAYDARASASVAS